MDQQSRNHDGVIGAKNKPLRRRWRFTASDGGTDRTDVLASQHSDELAGQNPLGSSGKKTGGDND